jgi:hypothetical protein
MSFESNGIIFMTQFLYFIEQIDGQTVFFEAHNNSIITWNGGSSIVKTVLATEGVRTGAQYGNIWVVPGPQLRDLKLFLDLKIKQ